MKQQFVAELVRGFDGFQLCLRRGRVPPINVAAISAKSQTLPQQSAALRHRKERNRGSKRVIGSGLALYTIASESELQRRMLLLLFCLIILATSGVFAQDIDNVVTPNGRKPFTFLDEIEDHGERADFLRLYQERDPVRRRNMAEAFLNSRPRSWLLATVYEIAAKAAIDLNDFPAALRYGKASLRFLPESPFLLVPLANVQVQQKAFREAESSANDALEYLDRFGRPASIAGTEWPRIENALRASSHYVLGRVAASEGLAAKGTESVVKLRSAAIHLSRGRELNDDDPEIAYLLGLVQKALGDGRGAAVQFRAAARMPGPLRQKANEQLRALERFEAESQEPTPASAVHAGSHVSNSRPNRYAGSQSCRTCHAGQHTAWEQTGMAKMFRPYRRENVIGDFNQREFPDNARSPLARMNGNGDALYFGLCARIRRAG